MTARPKSSQVIWQILKTSLGKITQISSPPWGSILYAGWKIGCILFLTFDLVFKFDNMHIKHSHTWQLALSQVKSYDRYWSNPERQDSITRHWGKHMLCKQIQRRHLVVLRVLPVYWYCKVSSAMLSFNSSTDLSTLHWDFSIKNTIRQDCTQISSPPWGIGSILYV